jgi:hypothetical protein
MLDEPVAVVQGGVQLMNYQSKWYSVLNVLEYFFWFKSRLHYHARLGMTPPGRQHRVLHAASAPARGRLG